jgi:FkbH-like protein
LSFQPAALPWLPPPPADFREACRALASDDPQVGVAIQALAMHTLSSAQATVLGKVIARLRAEGSTLAPLSPLRLAILPSATFDFVTTALPAAAARHGVDLDVRLFPAEQMEPLALGASSELLNRGLDAVFLAVDHRWLGLDRPALGGDHTDRIEGALARLREVAAAVARKGGATPIIPTLATPPAALFGSLDRRVPGSARAMIDAFNGGLLELCAEVSAVLFDVAAVAEAVGTASWFDAAMYNLYKLPFTPDGVALYCDAFARLLGGLRGRARKCLVLDLDNTCWGGVVGDDGLEGIRISPGDAQGNGFLAVQRAALDLKARGIILAVSSKNEDATARSPFRNHPDMLLRESDFAVFQANWNDKPSNLEAIARTLEIGLDSLVLLDDNAAERAQVRRALPMVAVPELPADSAFYAETLLAAGYFEAVSFSAEDRLRADSYSASAQRAEVKARSRDLGDYLASLEMRISHAPFDALNRARIAQLINKSNQFNLTTRRFTEAQLAEMELGAAAFTLQTRLSDRYGDFGMIGVVIAQEVAATGERTWDIDTWLMSCRVLGRKVEEAMLAQLVTAARREGIGTLTASYIPTAKNSMVAEHYDKLGFALTHAYENGQRDYRVELTSFVAPSSPF